MLLRLANRLAFKGDIIISKNVNDVPVCIKTFLNLVFPGTKYVEKRPKRR